MNNQLDDKKRKNIIRNGHIIKCVSEAICFCGQLCIALRGVSKVLNGESRCNTGNFLTALQMIANHDDFCRGQERLSFLAIRHIYYQVKMDLNEVVNLFATKHPQRLELGTILTD